ncbi:metal-dependent hydrolase [Eionea flava]
MDPVTQGVVGAIASQQISKRQILIAATVLGTLSGMAPDLDVLIKSDVDPLLGLEYHRHFTHSLLFIPFGGLLCALFFSFVFRSWFSRIGLSFKQVLLFCTLGYATHGLLDSLTTYGTQLLWPLSDMRVAWNVISIIDPLFTLPLLFFVILAMLLRRKEGVSRILSLGALCWAMAYISLGIIQRERAEVAMSVVAEARGHQPESIEAKPSFANILVWKVVYREGTRFYVDAIRVGWGVKLYEGGSIEQLNVVRDFPWLQEDSQQARDVERFRWFSNDYLAVSPRYPDRVIDMRYSLIPNQIKGLWGIELNPDANMHTHIRYVGDRDRNGSHFTTLWQMISGKDIETSN